jgi:hypothetical protein
MTPPARVIMVKGFVNQELVPGSFPPTFSNAAALRARALKTFVFTYILKRLLYVVLVALAVSAVFFAGVSGR